jgi:hypothetical protein
MVPKPVSPAVTQVHLTIRKIVAIRSVALPWVMWDCQFCPLKIRVSVVRLTAGRMRPLPSLRSGNYASLAGFAGWSAPGHHLI